jgi:hypothetical protein
VTPALNDAHERCMSWSGDPVGLVLAVNVVLAGLVRPDGLERLEGTRAGK